MNTTALPPTVETRSSLMNEKGKYYDAHAHREASPRPASVTAIASAQGTVASPVQKEALVNTRAPAVKDLRFDTRPRE